MAATRRWVLAVAWVAAVTVGMVLGLRDAPDGDPRWSTTTDCGTNLWPQCATGRGTFFSYALLIGAAASLAAVVAWLVQSRLTHREDPSSLRSPPRWEAVDGFRYVGLPLFVVAMLLGGVYFVLIHSSRYDSSFVRRLPDGFGAREAFMIDATDPVRARTTVVSILQNQYHVPREKAECMATKALGEGDPATVTRPTVIFGPRPSYRFEADELNSLAVACGVDFSGLWYMTD